MGIKMMYIFEIIKQKDNVITFESKQLNLEVKISILEEDIFKITFLKDRKLKLDKTWVVTPGMEDFDIEGRDRFEHSAFNLPKYKLIETGENVTILTEHLKAIIELNGMKISWFGKQNGEWVKIAQDRKTQAYNLDYWGKEVYHYLERNLEEEYFGFGEKSGKLNKHYRRMRMKNLDPMGYDAEYSDPLYKHIPFYITRNSKTNYSFGIFYDNFSTVTFEMGTELDNYHGLYRYFKAKDGDLDYYVIAGPKIKNVTERFSWLTGKTIFAPKWSIGYSGSTMTYTDLPDSQKLLNNFLEDCKKYVIPCDSFQLSSGYTSIGDKRYVFNWNKEKFPDVKAFTNSYHKNGIKLCANIKPAFLHDHPEFKKMKEKELFIKEKIGKEPELVQFWDDNGAYIDFTNKDAILWWKNNVKEKLLELGIDSTWNDNNEYEIWDSEAKCNGFGKEIDIELMRPIQTLLMMKSSYEAQKEFNPELRPYLISRAGCPGMQKYVQTWSGDNRTEWKTLKYNNYMAISLSLSGVYNLGHDVGGFSGPAPSPELFVRWIQNGIFYPRFTIHSWNDDKTVNVPWMYSDVLSEVKKAMNFRRKITPYIYNLLYQAHSQGTPIIKPTFYNYEEDKNTFFENDEFMLGDNLLVATVIKEGALKRKVYLPKGDNWYCYNTNKYYKGGKSIEVEADLNTFPLFVKEGAILPINNTENYNFADKDLDERAFIIYAPEKETELEFVSFEDDGATTNYKKGFYAEIKVKLKTFSDRVEIEIEKNGNENYIQKEYKIQVVDFKNREVRIN
ncbi:MAG: TIM-barrel domain-containing protein [Fusobacteriaceae bacterium]